jgi:hypothetical protein
MWGLLRIILLIANAVFFATLVYIVVPDTNPHEWSEYLGAYGMITCFALNFVYLLLSKGSNWRIFRLIGLWFDAKESELRQRADRSRQDE